ncbi:MAG: glycoside hydrolase family 88 protein [Prevotella sp.]|nr:glycoside hydrolase family 88 protein [Prevotella sp.]
MMGAAQGWDEAKYRQIEQSIRVPQFADAEFLITKYGAKPTNTAAQNQKAINKAIEKCSKKGGGKVIVPAGQKFLTGAITLLSHVNLVVEKDAVLEFVFDPSLYPIVPTRWEGLDCWNLSPLIYAYKQTDIAVTGEGTIDGGGSKETWWPWCGAPHYGWKQGMTSQRLGARPRLLKSAEDGVPMDERRFGPEDGLRPQLINFNQCEGILIENVTLLRSPFWVIHPLLSTDITVRGVHINNDGPNGDGCDPESCDRVMIENCFFNTGDDCIAIKSGRNNDGRLWDKPSENIIIRNCEMRNGHGGVVIGSEITGGCRNVYAHDNVMDSPNLDRVIRIKTNTCRGGIIENINARNIKVGQCRESVLKINLDYEPNEICCRGFAPTVRNVNIENITCEKSKYGVQIIALDSVCNVYDINVKNCRFNGVKDGNTITGQTRNVTYDNLFINGSLSLINAPYEHYSEWMTYSEMKRVPKPFLLDFATRPRWSYVMGIELESMLDTYLKYGGEDIRKYCQEYTDTMINEKGEIRTYKIEDYNLDQIRTGHFVARMYQNYPEAKNLKAMQTLMKQLENQPRTVEDKVFWHKAIYSYQVWLDGIFMGLPFHTMTARDLLKPQQAKKIYDDAVNQIAVTYKRTLDPKTGLNRHAWDETKEMFWADKETGLSQHCWGRAQGWYTMALIELLDVLPEDYARRAEVLDLLQKDLDAIIKWQDKATGLWYQVMDAPGREGNYLESTCSAMFAYVLLKAYNKGYLGVQYRDAGIKAYQGIIKNFIRVNEDKTISLTQCCEVAGLGPGVSAKVLKAAPTVKENKRRDGSFNYYISEPIRDNDAKGVGPFIWASLEIEKLGYNVNNVTAAIDRHALVTRNNPIITEPDALASLSVGNGHFAATVDVTGLQSFPFEYGAGVPLNSMSDWGWHSFENTNHLKVSETEKAFDLGHGHQEIYAVEYKQGGRNQEATEYFRVNPHRLNLGTIGLELRSADGSDIPLKDLKDLYQVQQLWNGEIESAFTADNERVEVMTGVHPAKDALYARIKSNLLKDRRAAIALRFSYPTGKHADDGNDWTKPELHQSQIISQDDHSALIGRTLGDTKYYVLLQWEGKASLTKRDRHYFVLNAEEDVVAFSAEYLPEAPDFAGKIAYEFDQYHKATLRQWNRFWQSGAAVDFSQCTDPRAKELERRVVLSQYLTQINCANNMPPQESGLTYNTWFGRPHLEMTWWHVVDFALWNRPETVGQILDWYNNTAYPVARKIAERQGFKGVRWMKMTDPWAGEAPSNTGSFLIWQQPHYIYLAEEMYRSNPTGETLRKYAEQVEATAEFMADFVTPPAASGALKSSHYTLRGATAMQESMSKDFSYNHPFELAYWQYGLRIAQLWRERQGKERVALWDDIIRRLSPLPEQEGIYTAGLPLGNVGSLEAFDPFDTVGQPKQPTVTTETFAEKCHNDHPAVLGACGLLPDNDKYTLLYNKEKMKNTLDWVMKNWNWQTTWGWDYGMIAMCAARLGDPQTALNALLIDTQKNTYLPSGHNFQTPDRLRIYLPGNGALLTAVAMMCAGWDGCTEPLNPGFPKDGTWNVRWEGLQRMQ